VLNALSDPHWNLPGVALFSRRYVSLLVKHVFRRDRRQRQDWAALLSLKRLLTILKNNELNVTFVNRLVAKILFRNPYSVVCRPEHLKLVRWMQQQGYHRWVYRLVNDQEGFFNYFINPTWYLVAGHHRNKIERKAFTNIA